MSRAPQLGADEVGGARFWICAVIGLAIAGFGLGGLLTADFLGSTGSWAVYFFGGLLVHDLLIAPFVVVVSATLLFVTGRRSRPVVQATAILIGVLTLASLPVLLGEGKLVSNPSLLPHDYARNLALVLVIVVIAAAIGIFRVSRRRSSPASAPGTPNGW